MIRARIAGAVRRAAARTPRRCLAFPPPRSLEASARAAGIGGSGDLVARLRSRATTYADVPSEVLSDLRRRFPDQERAAVSAAAAAAAHRFDLLGSGPFEPRDPHRHPHADGYVPIDWFLDPVRGARFPADVPAREWDLYTMRPAGTDIKLPWELARCQHFTALGQAWRITGDARYAQEVPRQIVDFAEANPVGVGIHYTCTMDVAIRAANWAIGLDLVRDAPDLPSVVAYEALFAQAQWVESHLEDTYEVTSNHLLSDLVGLFVVAGVFGDLAEGRRWDALCRERVEREIRVQVLPDGADYESSTAYHRLVTELLLSAARTAERTGPPLSEEYLTRLAGMVDYVVAVMRPDGLLPQVGDTDDGRLHIMSGHSSRAHLDARHLLGPASLLLRADRWRPFAGADAAWEAAWWGFDVRGTAFGGDPPPDVTVAHPHAGVATIRRGGTYLLVTNGPVGTAGFGNHKHNDQLSFEFHLDGSPLVVDPGSYVYTPDFAERNRFRSTACHSTLCVDGEEQNETRPEWIFRMFDSGPPRVDALSEGGGAITWAGGHVGYSRLAHGVAHDRALRLVPSEGTLVVLDRVTGTGRHELSWSFHLAPGVVVEGGGRLLLLAGPWGRHHLACPLDASVEPSWYSPSYGVREGSLVVRIRETVDLTGAPIERCFVLRPEGAAPDEDAAARTAAAAGWA